MPAFWGGGQTNDSVQPDDDRNGRRDVRDGDVRPARDAASPVADVGDVEPAKKLNVRSEFLDSEGIMGLLAL